VHVAQIATKEDRIMATNRIYIVTTPNGRHLIEAKTAAQAVRQAIRTGVECKAASSKDVADAMGAGLKLESAKVEE
jgi:hypothetical protein